MTNQKKLTIIPVYDEKKGCFLGYGVKEGGCFIKDEKGNKIILSVQSDDRGDYFVSYQEVKWALTPQEYEEDEEAQLKFKPKIENGAFQGFTILQYDEKEQKLMPRGTVHTKDIKYRRGSNKAIELLYDDCLSDGSCKTYLVAQMSQEEYDLLMKLS